MKSKKGKIVLIILLSILAVILISGMVIVMVNKDRDYSISIIGFGNRTELLDEKEFDVNEIKNISIDLSSSKVKFVEGTSNKVKVTAYGLPKEKVNINVNENTLEINKERTRIYLISFFLWNKNEVIVELPKDYTGDIRYKYIKWKCRNYRLREYKY